MKAQRAAAVSAGALLKKRALIFEPLVIEHRPKAPLDGMNARLHWAQKNRRAVFWRSEAARHAMAANWPRTLPDNGRGFVVAIIVIQARGPLPDDDNIRSMTKSLRDGIAAWLGCDDKPGGIEWQYEWLRGRRECTTVDLFDMRRDK